MANETSFFPCYAGGSSVQYLAAFAILIASLSVFLSVRSDKQFQRLHLNQGALHDHRYMALNLDIVLFYEFTIYTLNLLWNINQLLCSSIVAFILDTSENLNTESFWFLQGTRKKKTVLWAQCKRSIWGRHKFVSRFDFLLLVLYWKCYKNYYLVYRVVIYL